MNRKYQNLRIDELQRIEKELRKKYHKTKQVGIVQEIRDVEQVIRDKIWNTGGAQWKKDNVK
jgi:Zn-finger domain-containing protein